MITQEIMCLQRADEDGAFGARKLQLSHQVQRSGLNQEAPMRRLFAIAAFVLAIPVPMFSVTTGASALQKVAGPDAPPRSVTLLDDGWQFYPLPDFSLWPAEAELSQEQIRQLKPPAPGQGWRPIHLPDDYIVRGTFSPEPNSSLLADGAVCPLGGRECGVPGAEPQQGKPGALNRPGRNNYGGHGYLPLYPAWYERDLNLAQSDRDKSVWLDFGGVYRDAIVFINGKFVAQHARRLHCIPAEHYFSSSIWRSRIPLRYSSIPAGLRAGGMKVEEFIATCD